MPSQRSLADAAGASRTTVAAALFELVRRGWAEPRRNARFVARLPDASRQRLSPHRAAPDPSVGRARVSAPAAELDAALERARARLHPHLRGDGRSRGGLAELRELVAHRYAVSGLPTSPDQVVITNGTMGALAVTVDATRGPVVVEDPTYHGALELFRRRRRRMLAWHRDRRWNIESLTALVDTHRPALVYVVPDFHNPTGRLADDVEREELATLAHRTLVVVDETLRDLSLDPTVRLPPHSARHHREMATIGGLSKTVWSGLQIGWLRLPDRGHDVLRSMIDVIALPVVEQLVAVELWDQIDELTATRRRRLREQRDAMCDALTLAGLVHEVPSGGLVCWVDLGRRVAPQVSTALNASGFQAAPGPRFSCTGSWLTHLRLPFTSAADEIGATIDRLSNELHRRE